MAEEERKNIPGIKKSKEKHKVNKGINPTKQKASAELPTTQKYEFHPAKSQFYNNSPSWLPQDGIKIDQAQIEEAAKQKQNIPIEEHVKKEQEAKANDIKSKLDNKQKTQSKGPSDIEIAMKQAQMSSEQISTETKKYQPPEIDISKVNIPEQQKAPEVNVFGTINSMDIPKEEEPKKKQELSNEKLLMKVDNTEVKLAQNESGEDIYIIGKKQSDYAKFKEFLQSVSGKILALECKKIEVGGVTYTKQGDGNFKSSNGEDVSMDDMLSIIQVG